VTPAPKAEAVSPQRAAVLLSVGASTILRLIRNGKLRAIRVGRQWRIKLADLQKGAPN